MPCLSVVSPTVIQKRLILKTILKFFNSAGCVNVLLNLLAVEGEKKKRPSCNSLLIQHITFAMPVKQNSVKHPLWEIESEC